MSFKTINVPDKNIQLIQDNVTQALNFSANLLTVTTINGTQNIDRGNIGSPFMGGNLIDITLTAAADNLVPHGLNRLPQLWVLCRLDAQSTIWEKKTAQLNDANGNAQSATNQFLNLWVSTSCHVRLWVN